MDGVFAVTAVQRQKFTKKFVLRLVGKIIELQSAFEVLSLHFLQQQNVWIQMLQRTGNAIDFGVAIQRRHAFVDVVSGDGESLIHGMPVVVWCENGALKVSCKQFTGRLLMCQLCSIKVAIACRLEGE